MKIRMKTFARGPDFSADPGDLVDVPDAVGHRLVASGGAEEDKPTWSPLPSIEVADIQEPAEVATSPDEPRRVSGFRKGGRKL